jgi:acyl-coenzyme A thioesterase PaaI-like protein
VSGAGRARGAQFKMMVTNADGSRTAETLTVLGIMEVDLRPDTTQVALPGGSRITGQASFVIGGLRQTAADQVRGMQVHLLASLLAKRATYGTGYQNTCTP